MKYGSVCLNKDSFMKRFLLSGVMLLAMECAAYCYTNDAVVQVPTMNPDLIQLDDPIFVNNGSFTVDILQFLGEATVNYETSDTLTYINNGTMTGIPGFDFENFPATVGQRHWADTFINHANGFGGGVISAENIFGGLNEWANGATTIGGIPISFETSGLANVIVRATNIVNNGLITMDSTGLIDLMGKEVNLDHAVFQMTDIGSSFIGSSSANLILLDGGGGGFGTNTAHWTPNIDLTPNQALSPIFTNFNGLIEQMFLQTATPYFQNTAPAPGADGVIVWRVVYLQDSSPTNVSAQVSFGNQGFDDGAFHIQWAGFYRNPLTGNLVTNYFGMSDDPAARRGQFYFDPAFNAQNLSEFSFLESPGPIFAGPPVASAYVPDPFVPAVVTNDFGFISILPTATSVATNQIPGGSPTNLPGRIQLTSSNSLNLANTHILGGNYLSLTAPVNFQGNTNSIIEMPYTDLNLGVTSGSLTISNLLVPLLPGYSGSTVSGAAIFNSGGTGIQAFSGSYFFVDANGVTNDVRVLLVSSSLEPDFAAVQQNVAFHATHDLTIADQLNIINSFTSDTASLTVTTNANSAYSLDGELNLYNQNVFYSALSLPNLQYLTNWGRIVTTNLANFAGNITSSFSPRAGAAPYKAFVNHGYIADQGIFVKANYFENSGTMVEFPVGNIDLSIGGTAAITNGTLSAINGSMSLAGSSLLISNSVIISGRTLTFTPSCFLSDGYAFGNEFGHATNATLPNVVTNGNTFQTGGGVQILATPASGDLLGTTITNIALNSLVSINVWSGEDRGASPAGFAENLALGRMILNSDTNPATFIFAPLNGNNALYVDSIEFKGGATNTDNNGNFPAITIQPGMKIYYAQALMNGVSIAEKLNGKNNGGFVWVSNYAGVYSATNLNGTLYNEALVISPDIDSDNDNIVNRDDPTPIPAGLTFDVANSGPIACGSGSNPSGDQGQDTTNNVAHTPGLLNFPAEQQQGGSGGSVSFILAQGSYNGLFYETNGVNPSHAGSFTAKLNRRGMFTGKLQLGTATYSFTKSFDSSGNRTAFPLKGKTPLTLTLQLVNNDEITGQVSGGDWTAQLLAFNSVNNATSFGTGKHSLVLSANTDSSTTTSGDSYGTMTLNKNGNIQWTGVLPDGAKVSQKSTLSKDGMWPLYSSLYGGNGSLIGWLQVTNGSSDIGGSAIWVTPANANSLFPNGVTNQLDATGSDITSSAGASQKTLILSGPQLSAPLTNSVTISGKKGSGDNSLTLSLDAKTGLFSGSMIDPGSSEKLSFQGALLEKSGMGGGFFLNADKNQGGKVSLAPAN
jgi:hypothetical protein